MLWERVSLPLRSSLHPGFYFECIFIGVAEESGQTNNAAVVSRTADVEMQLRILERHLHGERRQKHDPLYGDTKYKAFKVHRYAMSL